MIIAKLDRALNYRREDSGLNPSRSTNFLNYLSRIIFYDFFIKKSLKLVFNWLNIIKL